MEAVASEMEFRIDCRLGFGVVAGSICDFLHGGATGYVANLDPLAGRIELRRRPGL